MLIVVDKNLKTAMKELSKLIIDFREEMYGENFYQSHLNLLWSI